MSCCVPYCSSHKRKKERQSFHEFPVDERLRQAWLEAVRRKGFVPNDKSSSSLVCGVHFQSSDFRQGLTARRCLKREAVPSIFPGYPPYLQSPPPKKHSMFVRKELDQKIELREEVQSSPEQNSGATDHSGPVAQFDSGATKSGCPRQGLQLETVISPVSLPAVKKKPVQDANSGDTLTLSSDLQLETDIFHLSVPAIKEEPAEDASSGDALTLSRDLQLETVISSVSVPAVEQKFVQGVNSEYAFPSSPDKRVKPPFTTIASATQTTEDLLPRRQRDFTEIQRLRVTVCRRNNTVQRLKEENEILKRELAAFEKDTLHSTLHKCLQLQKISSTKVSFEDCLIEQLGNALRARPVWSPEFVKECLTLYSISPKAYHHIKSRGLFNLPSKSTIIRLFHKSEGESGVGLSMEKQLKDEAASMEDEVRMCSVGVGEAEHLEGQGRSCPVVDEAEHLKDEERLCAIAVEGAEQLEDQERPCSVVVDEAEHLVDQAKLGSIAVDEAEHLEGQERPCSIVVGEAEHPEAQEKSGSDVDDEAEHLETRERQCSVVNDEAEHLEGQDHHAQSCLMKLNVQKTKWKAFLVVDDKMTES